MRLVIFTEEESMAVVLRILLPRLGVAAGNFTIIAHQGVSDLERSLRRKLRNWQDPRARFLILRDNDRGDCRKRKESLMLIVKGAHQEDRTKVRIVVEELEAWFLGDLPALEAAGIARPGTGLAILKRDPESHAKPSDVLKRLKRGYQKTLGARQIAPHLNLTENRATSFVNSIAAIRELADINGA